MPKIGPKLYEFATVRQLELLEAIDKHGQTMLAFHHGHLSKNDSLPLLFASQFAATWGATKKNATAT